MPNGILTYQSGAIRWVKLDPTLGVEIKKTRAWMRYTPETGFRVPTRLKAAVR